MAGRQHEALCLGGGAGGPYFGGIRSSSVPHIPCAGSRVHPVRPLRVSTTVLGKGLGEGNRGGRAAPGTLGLWPSSSTCSLFPAELLGPAGGSLHSAHGGCPQPALLQGVEAVDCGAAGCAHVCPQLCRLLPLLQQHLGCPLGRGVLGAVTRGRWAAPSFSSSAQLGECIPTAPRRHAGPSPFTGSPGASHSPAGSGRQCGEPGHWACPS